MVIQRHIFALFVCLSAVFFSVAQNYATIDTVTEYPNKGTFYHDKFEGRKTANGEIFDQNKFTAAHWKIKLGTMVMVTNQNNGMQVIVRVNDRCPKHGVFDLSHRAATAIGIRGCQPVTVRILPDGYEERWLAQETMFDSVYSRLSISNKIATDEKKEEVEKQIPTPKEDPKPATAEFNLDLGTVSNHSEAYDIIQKLPNIYQSKVLIDTLDNSNMLQLTLDVRLPKDNAEELRRALMHSIPNISISEAL